MIKILRNLWKTNLQLWNYCWLEAFLFHVHDAVVEVGKKFVDCIIKLLHAGGWRRGGGEARHGIGPVAKSWKFIF